MIALAAPPGQKTRTAGPTAGPCQLHFFQLAARANTSQGVRFCQSAKHPQVDRSGRALPRVRLFRNSPPQRPRITRTAGETNPSTEASMPDPIHLIPLAEIDAGALTRDRTGLDPEPQDELELSIAASGLRQPIELFPLASRGTSTARPALRLPPPARLPRPARRAAQDRFAAIPAFLRESDRPRRRPGRQGRGERNPRRPVALRARPDRRHRPQPGRLRLDRGGRRKALPQRPRQSDRACATSPTSPRKSRAT